MANLIADLFKLLAVVAGSGAILLWAIAMLFAEAPVA